MDWDEILGELPAEARASTRAAVDAAVHEYLSGSGDSQSSAERAQIWRRVEKRADSKSIAAFRDAIQKLGSYKPLDPEAKWLLELADQLVVAPKKARARTLLYRPRSKKSRLYTDLIGSWTNAGGFLGASEEGPLQRFLCRVVRKIGLRLSDRGAKAAIQREQERRATLKVLDLDFAPQGGMSADAFVIDPSGRGKGD